MNLQIPQLFGLFFVGRLVLGQTINLSDCIGPLTATPNCNFYASKLTACNSLVGSAAGNCYCPQTVLNAIAGCEGEFRLCADGYEFDSQFEGPDGFFGLWHSACDGFITYSPTTPAIATLGTQTADGGACLTAENYCASLIASTESCSTSYTALQEYDSCLCQATILDLASRCEIDGSVSCLLETPITTNLFSYQYCRGSGISTKTSSVSEISSRVIVTTETSIMSTAAPSGTASTLGTTATPTGFTDKLLQLNPLLFAACWIVVTVQLM